VLFTGTLRENLDPSGEYTDQEIWHALELSHLKPFVEGQGLEHQCGENGESLR
jgi:ABC-type multidrug transport system fused ATPase/permease subunit